LLPRSAKRECSPVIFQWLDNPPMSQNQQRFFIAGLIAAVIFICVAIVAAAVYMGRQLGAEEPLTGVDIAEGRSLNEEQGVLVTNVRADGPAWQGGLRRGDIILRLNDHIINNTADLQLALREAGPNTAVSLTLRTGSNIRNVQVTLADAPPLLGADVIENQFNTVTPTQLPPPVTDGQTPPAEPQQRPLAGRALITGVVPDSPAQKAGLQAGDIIVVINDEAILTGRELVATIESHPSGDSLTIMLRRGPDTLVVAVTLDPHPDDASRGFLGVQLPPTP